MSAEDFAMMERLQPLNDELVEAAREIKVLSAIAWPPELADVFLDGLEKGDPHIPEPPPVDLAGAGLEERVPVLERLSRPIDDHPLARFIARTAESYLLAARLLRNAGTPTFTEISLELYGGPDDIVAPGGLTNIAAAEHLIAVTDDLADICSEDAEDFCLLASAVQEEMAKTFAKDFTDPPLEIVIDDTLSAKAAAGPDRIRLRAGTCFAPADIAQLTHHEAYVHSGTSRNGRRQPRLSCLSLGAPRTTATQEGLATLAELITTAIDLNRLRRLALRIKGTSVALDGGDFLDVFGVFHESGQSRRESYFSASRVFRGGDPRGGACFTKDTVYLRGLLGTHTYFLTALHERRLDSLTQIFAGRMTWADVGELAPFFKSGVIEPPAIVPPWVTDRRRLAAWLAFNNLTHRLPMETVRLEDYVPRDHVPGTTMRWARGRHDS